MKGILINPFNRTLTEIIIGEALEDVYQAITNDKIGPVRCIERVQLAQGQDLWLDEEGTFKPLQKKFAIIVLGFRKFTGCAILLGSNAEGDSWGDTIIKAEHLMPSMIWEK